MKRKYISYILIMMLLSLTLCSCKSAKERDAGEDDNFEETVETKNNKVKEEDKPDNKDEFENTKEGKIEEIPDGEPREEDSLENDEKKKAEELEDTKIQGLVEKYRDNYEGMSDEEYSTIFDWIGVYHGFFANEEGTAKVSIANYGDYYGSFSFAGGYIEVYGYELLGAWEVCGKNKAKLVGTTGWESVDEKYHDSALELMFNEIIVDFSDYEKDESVTVIINDNLKYKCNKIINYYEP